MSDMVYKLKEAAREAKVSVDTIKRAIHATDPAAWPPPLRAKRQGRSMNAPLAVEEHELRAWIKLWPDA